MKINKSLVQLLFWFLGTGYLFSQQDFTELTTLPNQVSETSGLIYFDGSLITHNDSGNAPELFEIDVQTGEVVRSVQIENAVNKDWEDLTQDDEFIYIGDFGNFSGDRRDLVIYKIRKDDYLTQDKVEAIPISFVYEDQTSFNSSPNSDWDAEAFFSSGDYLFVLTKEWQSQNTSIYRISKDASFTTAIKVEEYPVNGLVTGATYDDALKQLVIVGYSLFLQPFVLKIEEVPESAPFFIRPIKENLEVLPLQIEAVASDGERFYFTNEEYINSSFGITSDARLFFFEVTLPNSIQSQCSSEELILYAKRGEDVLNYYGCSENGFPIGYVVYDNSGKEVILKSEMISDTGSIDTSTLSSGIYHARFFFTEREVVKSFIKL
ncbi:MAG: T9SS type A sorting domain-containing protein [Bacteroidota bacterium]